MATTPHTTTTVQGLTRPVWRIILVCLLVTVMEGYNVIVFGSVIPLILADPGMEITSEGIGLIGSMTYIGMFFGGTAAGFLGDRHGRKRLLIIVIFVFFAGALLSGFATGAIMLGIARLVAGLGVGGAITMSLALASSGAPSRDAGTVVTVTMAGIPLGGAIASLIGMSVLPAFGWRVMFLIGAALTLLILVVVLRSTLEVASAKAPEMLSRRVTLLSLFRERGAALMLLISLIAVPTMFVWYGINTWLIDAMTELKAPLTSALLFGFVLSGGAIIGSFLIMRWADHWGVAKVGTVMSALTVLGLVALAFGPRNLGLALGAVAVIGAGGQSTINLLQAAVSTFFPPQMRATSLGWSNGVSYIGAITGPAAGGFVLASAAGPVGVFVLFAAVGALVVVATAVLAIWSSATHGHPGRQKVREEPSR